jgi:adenine-specific DNA-methyltransferase
MTISTPPDSQRLLEHRLQRASQALSLPLAVLPERGLFAPSRSGSDCELLRGDNLRALTALVDAQAPGFDFCYIDPPYNTGQQFVYSDAFKSPDERAPWGRHTGWMSFMLPRLVAAHALLEPHGIIAISIDDYEVACLKTLMDVVFGEQNFIATLVVVRSKNGKGSHPHVAVNHEYVLLYARSDAASVGGLHEIDTTSYNKSDEHGHFKIDGLFRKKGDASLRTDRPNMYYPLYYSRSGEVFTTEAAPGLGVAWPVDSKGVERRWLWGSDKASKESWKLYASPGGVIYVKNYNATDKRVKLRSVLDSSEYLTDRATTETKAIFGEKVFETPKPIALIRDLLDACCANASGRVLDFFAGTGTTAEAVQELNARDGGRRTTLLIEQDAAIPAGHVAARLGYRSIPDITQARLAHVKRRFPSFTFSETALPG